MPRCGSVLSAFSFVALMALQAAEPPTDPKGRPDGTRILSEGPLEVVDRGGHHRAVRWTTRTVDAAGVTETLTNSYTEVASGLHFVDEKGVWQESVAEFVPTRDGFLAARGPHQVALSRNLHSEGAVTVVTPEGQTLRSTPTLLAYVDRVTGESVRLADLHPTKGQLIAPNVVLYPDAFDSVAADVRAVYTIGAFEFDVVLRRQLPDPAKFGMDPATTDLAVYTEFFDTRPTAKHAQEHPGKDGDKRADVRLDFGSMVMARGKSFSLDAGVDSDEAADVRKEWGPIEGRDFLIERTAYLDLQPLLKALPRAAAPSPDQLRRAEKLRRTAKLELPAAPGVAPGWPRTPQGRLVVQTASGRPEAESVGAELASSSEPRYASAPGVVLDYSIIFTSMTGYTFDSLTTYLITGMVNISGGPAVFQAGTVIKFDVPANNPSLNILSGSTLDWQGAPYRPVVLTARYDHSVGQPILASAGPLTGYFATTALKLDNMGVVTLSNLSVRNASIGVEATGSTRPTLRHAQFVNCITGVKVDFNTTLENVLFHNVTRALWTAGIYGSTGEFITVDAAQLVNYTTSSTTPGQLTLKNSILASVVSPNTDVTPQNTFIAPAASFVTAGSGAHYLDVDKTWVRSATATGPFAPSMSSDIPRMTVRPPGQVPATVTADLVLPSLPLVEGDISTARWGYHYWPVHYLAPGTTVTGATVTLTNGVVVAGTEGTAFMLNSGGKFVSTGRPDAMDRLTYATLVQEQPSGTVPSLTRRFIDVATAIPAVRPEVRLRFTAMDHNADVATRRALLNVDNRFLGAVDIRDSQFRQVKFSLAPAASPGPAQTVAFINNVWQVCDVTVYRFYDALLTSELRHNLFSAGALSLQYTSFGSNPVWTVRDNLFASTTLSTSIPGASLSSGWNAYTDPTAVFGGSFNLLNMPAVLNWANPPGPLGAFYYPVTGSSGLNTLRNVGSRTADLAGLYHHTTRVDQMKEGVESPAQVDIGFHYVATTGSGSTTPVDTDADTLPDYLEDANGSGAQNGTETAWQNADSDADGALDNEEIAGGTDPLSKASWIPKRLAYWSFDGTSTVPSDANYWKRGDRGQAPVVDLNGDTIAGVSGQGVRVIKAGKTGALRYALKDSNGRLNMRLDQGGVRFWFKPDWAAPTTGAGHPLEATARLLEVGQYNTPALGYWSWMFYKQAGNGDPQTGLVLWMQQYRYSMGDNHLNLDLPVYRQPTAPGNDDYGNWNQTNWHEMSLAYFDYVGSPVGTSASINGNGVRWHNGNYYCPLITDPCYVYGGEPITTANLPGVNVLATATDFALGSDRTGTAAPAEGTFDSVETVNWTLGDVDGYTRQQLTSQVTLGGQLEFTRPFEGASLTVGSVKSLPWHLRLSRRELAPTPTATWTLVRDETSPSTPGIQSAKFTDPAVQPGNTYEYKAELLAIGGGWGKRQFVAGIRMPVQHYRGNVFLLVGRTLASGPPPEAGHLKSPLAGGGW